MHQCTLCSEPIPSWTRIDGVPKNLSSRKHCLQCSPWGEHNTRNLVEALTPRMTKLCRGVCNRTLPLTDFCETKKGGRHSYCRACDRQRQRDRHRDLKKEAVLYRGGKCNICGYSRCISALDFHHLDPSQKDFTVSVKKGTLDAEMKLELDKCVLLCSNCHREVHAGLTQLVECILPKDDVAGSNPVSCSD